MKRYDKTKVRLLICLISALPLAAGAQVTIGSTGEASRAAILDLKTQPPGKPASATDNANITSTRGGLILPRVRLQNETTLEPFIPTNDPDWINSNASGIKLLHAGLTVYNLTSSSAFEPGYYSWNGSRWEISKAHLRRGGNGIIDTNDTLQIGGQIEKPTEIITDHPIILEGNGEVKLDIPLIVTGGFKYAVGSPGHQKLFLSDQSGNASWQNNNALQTTPSPIFSQLGCTITFDQNYNNFESTGTSIILPPGRWCIMVTMHAYIQPAQAVNPDDRIWLRSTFIEEGKTARDSMYFVNNNQLISGQIRPGKNVITGFVVMKNETVKPIKFFYSVGDIEYGGGRRNTLQYFGGSMQDENSIVAFAVGK